MNILDIKKRLARKAIIYTSTKEITSNYIGSVPLCSPDEIALPNDGNGNSMCPLVLIDLSTSSSLPSILNDLGHIAVFISSDIFDNLENINKYFKIRTYAKGQKLVDSHYPAHPQLNPVYLKSSIVDNDYPVWDGFDIDAKVFDAICEIEDQENKDYYEDIVEEMYTAHKIGGYGSFIQGGFEFENGYEFVMQIASDDLAKLNIVDGGNLYFAYNKQKKDWQAYCDFY